MVPAGYSTAAALWLLRTLRFEGLDGTPPLAGKRAHQPLVSAIRTASDRGLGPLDTAAGVCGMYLAARALLILLIF
jgi:hypothetical protein